MRYIEHKRPTLVMIENVSSFVKQFRTVFEEMVGALEACGYAVLNKKDCVTNTMDHGLPHSRPRMILFACLKDRVKHPWKQPAPLTHYVSFSSLTPPTKKRGRLPGPNTAFRQKALRLVIRAQRVQLSLVLCAVCLSFA